MVTKGQVNRILACDAHAPELPSPAAPPSLSRASGAMVDAAFRQLVTLGEIDGAVTDALAALRVEGRHDELLAWIAELPTGEWATLAADVEERVDRLRRGWPPLDPGWMPRTQEPMRAVIGGGAVELATRVDLALGVPGQPVSSVALVEVKSGIVRPEHRDELRFVALVEALRHPAPPFTVAAYYTRTGALEVEAVTEEVLFDAADRTVAGALRLLDDQCARPLGRPPGEMCAGCRWRAAGAQWTTPAAEQPVSGGRPW